MNGDQSQSMHPVEPDDIMPLILSAFDRIVADRQCEHRDECYLGRNCKCFSDAEARVRRQEIGNG